MIDNVAISIIFMVNWVRFSDIFVMRPIHRYKQKLIEGYLLYNHNNNNEL